MIIHDFLGRLQGVKLVPHKTDEWVALCPGHNDRNPSLRIKLVENKILLQCGSCKEETLARVNQALGLEDKDWFTDTPEWNAFPSRPVARTHTAPAPFTITPRMVSAYVFTDESGNPVGREERWEPGDDGRTKKCLPAMSDGHGGWTYGWPEEKRILYNIPWLVASAKDPTSVVNLCEGPKNAERLTREGEIATAFLFGATSWLPQYEKYLVGRHVVLHEDNDGAGRRHVEVLAKMLYDKAASVKVLTYRDLPEHNDVEDWLDAGHSIDELRQRVVDAPVWVPPSEPRISPEDQLALNRELAAVAAVSRDTWGFRREGDDFYFTFEDATTIDVTGVRAKRGGITGLVHVNHPAYGRLDHGPLDLSSRTAVATVQKKLLARVPDLDWVHHFDQVAYIVQTEFQREEKEQPLSEVPFVPVQFAVEPLVPLNLPTFFYGQPGHGKTTLTLALAVSLVTRIELPGAIRPRPEAIGPVLNLDYEGEETTARRGVERIALAMGADPASVLPQIFYVRMERPLVDTAAWVRSMIERRGIKTVVVDSWKAACGVTGAGDPGDSALAAFGAIRTYRRTVLVVAHPPKNGEGIYGSTFNLAYARSVVKVERIGDPHSLEMNLVLTQDKVNPTTRHSPIGLSFLHTPDPDAPMSPILSRITSHDLRGEPEGQVSRWGKVKAVLLRHRRMFSPQELADITGLGVASVHTVLNENNDELAKANDPHRKNGKLYGLADNRGREE